MVHLPQSVIQSGLKVLGRKEGFDVSAMWQKIYGKPLTLGDKTFQRVCQKCSESGDPEDPVDLKVKLYGSNSFEFTDRMNMTLSDVEFEIKDKNGDLMTNFVLVNVNFVMWIGSEPEIALIKNDLSNLKFESQQIIQQGNVWLDIREIMRDNSNAFNDIAGDINGKFYQRYKEYNPLVFFDEVETDIVNGIFFGGL